MVKITPEVAQALTNLRGNSDFSTIITWIEENEARETQACIKQDGLLLFRAQGAVGALQELLKAYVDAPQTLKRFQSTRPV